MTQTEEAVALVPDFGDDEERKIAFVCSKGTLDMAYPALIMANGALTEGVEVDIRADRVACARTESAGTAVDAPPVVLGVDHAAVEVGLVDRQAVALEHVGAPPAVEEPQATLL